jgi:hypothetical protein
MTNDFVLSSQDFRDSEDRLCAVVSQPTGRRRGSNYVLVKVTPPLRSSFWDEPERDFDQLLLSFVGPGSLEGIGKTDVLADIVLCPSYAGGVVDERDCARIGIGSLHQKS